MYLAVEAMQQAGAASWSLDLISGLPHLSARSWEHSLREAVRLRPDHVSVYDLQVRSLPACCRSWQRGLPCSDSTHAAGLPQPGGWARVPRVHRTASTAAARCALQVEDNTPFARWYQPGAQPLPSNDESADMYRRASAVLRAAGYEHYEVSSYAQPGHRRARRTR